MRSAPHAEQEWRREAGKTRTFSAYCVAKSEVRARFSWAGYATTAGAIQARARVPQRCRSRAEGQVVAETAADPVAAPQSCQSRCRRQEKLFSDPGSEEGSHQEAALDQEA